MINPINETSIPYKSLKPEQVGVKPPGFRAPASTRVGVVRLQIADLGRSLDYYQSIIGFHVLERSNASARLGTPDGKALLELIEKPGVRFAPRNHHGPHPLLHG